MKHHPELTGPIFTAAFQTTALTANAHDIFGILAPSNSRVRIHEVCLAQPSTESPDDRLGVRLLRGSTASSTATALSPRHIHGWSGVPAAGSSVTFGCTTLVSTASAVLLYADSFFYNIFNFRPDPCDRPVLDVDQRLHVRITAPSTGRMNGTITWSEIGAPS
jgi:hypothetical protein